MPETALFVGRFQPFHNGHRKSVVSILDDVDEIVVAIGSADSSHTKHDPFTAGERIRMIRKNFVDMRSCVYTVPIVDINRNSVWTRHIESLCPSFDVVYTNNDLVSRLFKEDDFEVRNHNMYDKSKYSGTKVRKKIQNGDGWRHLVPDETEEVIDDIAGVYRIRELS